MRPWEIMFVGAMDREMIERLAAEHAANCFFCPEKVEGTAKFTHELTAEGRVHVGESVLFPMKSGTMLDEEWESYAAMSDEQWQNCASC